MNVTVLGLGRVGAIAAACLAEAGHHVTGIDVDRHRVESLQTGRTDFFEPGLDDLLQQVLSSGLLSLACLADTKTLPSQATLVTVGTPSLPSGRADLSQIKTALEWIAEKSDRQTLVIMKSTLPPGTGKMLAQRYRLPYVASPEFLRQGQAVDDWRRPHRVVIGGENTRDIDIAREVFASMEAPFIVTDITTAEMIKYASNAFLSTKISFVNEMANLCDTLGADIEDVAAGMALDPRIGPSFLHAGIGYGGSCFPKDVRALEFTSNLNGYSCDLLRAVISVNRRQRLLPMHILRRELGPLDGRQIAVLGLAFKPGTDDVRESPALDIIRALLEEGAQVRAYDPMVQPGGSQALPEGVCYAPGAEKALAGAEAAVLCTEWEEFCGLDWERVKTAMQPPYLLIDGRNALPPDIGNRFGFKYMGVGRGTSSPKAGRGQ